MKLALILLVAGLVNTAHGQGVQPQVSAAEREARWRQDLQFFATAMEAQKDFSKLYPKVIFDRELAALKEGISDQPDSEIVLRLMCLVASANVAHNTVLTPPTMGFFARLPLTFRWYSDGLAVTAATQQYSAAIGARVLGIGTMTPEQLLAGVSPYISHETDGWLRQAAAGLIPVRGVLEHFRLFSKEGMVSVNLQKPGGTPFTLSVGLANPQVARIPLDVPAPLFQSQPGKYYWYEYLPDSQTMYIQYDVCANDPKLSFDDFARKVLAETDAHPVKRVVVDLRQNGGGNSRVIGPLKSGLASRLKKVGRVYVLIGPETFSSASMNAVELRDSLHATFVGETTGGLSGGYGEIKIFTLPNSKLSVQYTTKFFGSDKDGLKPDLEVPRTLTDTLAGRDAVLEAAIGAR